MGQDFMLYYDPPERKPAYNAEVWRLQGEIVEQHATIKSLMAALEGAIEGCPNCGGAGHEWARSDDGEMKVGCPDCYEWRAVVAKAKGECK